MNGNDPLANPPRLQGLGLGDNTTSNSGGMPVNNSNNGDGGGGGASFLSPATVVVNDSLGESSSLPGSPLGRTYNPAGAASRRTSIVGVSGAVTHGAQPSSLTISTLSHVKSTESLNSVSAGTPQRLGTPLTKQPSNEAFQPHPHPQPQYPAATTFPVAGSGTGDLQRQISNTSKTSAVSNSFGRMEGCVSPAEINFVPPPLSGGSMSGNRSRGSSGNALGGISSSDQRPEILNGSNVQQSPGPNMPKTAAAVSAMQTGAAAASAIGQAQQRQATSANIAAHPGGKPPSSAAAALKRRQAELELPDIPQSSKAASRRTFQEANKIMNEDLEKILEQHEPMAKRVRPWDMSILREGHRTYGIQSTLTILLLLIATCAFPNWETVFSTSVVVLFYTMFEFIETMFTWMRVVEWPLRCIRAIKNHLHAGGFDPRPMKGFRGISLDSTALRLCTVLRQGLLQLVPKVLLVKGDICFVSKTGKSEVFNDCSMASKLGEIMRYALEHRKILLPKISGVAKPPRFPNLMRDFEEEEDESSDESDIDDEMGATEQRTKYVGGRYVPTVPMAMEWATGRLLLLIWAVTLTGLVLVGIVRGAMLGNFAEELFFYPAVAVLGLLPLNNLLLNRVLTLLANAALFNSIEFLKKQKSMFNFLNRDEQVPIGVRDTFDRAIRCLQVNNLDKPMCFSTNSVECLGFLTVVAPLDFEGVLTDIVTVPVTCLFINPNEGESSESSSGDDDENAALMSEQKVHERKTRTKRLRMQVRRAKFQQKRFTQLELTSTAIEHLPTEFLQESDVTNNFTNLEPLCLAIVIHSIFSKQFRKDNASVTQRHIDRTIVWARCCHWMARAAEFCDADATSYKPIRRVHMVRTLTSPRRVEQICGLLVTPDEGKTLHLFTIGNIAMIVDRCSSYWTGDGWEEFDEHEKEELTTVGLEQWERGRTLECVAFSHRILPTRYNKFFPVPKTRSHVVEEEYFKNNVKVEKLFGPSAPDGSRRTRSNSATQPRPPHFEESEIRPALRPTNSRRRLSFGCKPHTGGLELDATLDSSNATLMMMSWNHTFLGLVGLRDNVRPNVESAVAMLDRAGIRLTHFGNGTEAHTKAFGSRLGLETDFNSCVSLKDEAVALDPKSIRAQLPFGIKSIRKHLVHVDHIPLQVSLFSHSHSASTRSMVSVMQDNYEVVCVLGSGINHGHMRSFVQADVAITVTPTTLGSVLERADILNRPGEEERYIDLTREQTGKNLEALTHLLGSCSALRIPPTSNALPLMTVLIRESRLLVRAISQSGEFTIHCNCFLVMLHSICLVFGLPLLTSATGTIWLLNVVFPLLSLGCTYTDKSPIPVMKMMPNKHSTRVRLRIFGHSAKKCILTFMPTTLFLTVVGIMLFSWSTEKQAMLIWRSPSKTGITDAEISLVRGFITMSINYLLIFHALCYISRHQFVMLFLRKPSTKYFEAYRCVRWMMFSLATIFTTFVFLIISSQAHFRDFHRIPNSVIFLVLLYPIAIILLDFPLKKYREKRFSDMQKFRRLFFQTKLGMHSPRGDYEPSLSSASEQRQGGGEANGSEVKKLTWKEWCEKFLYDWTTVQGGRMERNSVMDDD